MVVNCGLLSPEIAMNNTLSRQARSIARLLTIPREYASSTTLSITAGL